MKIAQKNKHSNENVQRDSIRARVFVQLSRTLYVNSLLRLCELAEIVFLIFHCLDNGFMRTLKRISRNLFFYLFISFFFFFLGEISCP